MQFQTTSTQQSQSSQSTVGRGREMISNFQTLDCKDNKIMKGRRGAVRIVREGTRKEQLWTRTFKPLLCFCLKAEWAPRAPVRLCLPGRMEQQALELWGLGKSPTLSFLNRICPFRPSCHCSSPRFSSSHVSPSLTSHLPLLSSCRNCCMSPRILTKSPSSIPISAFNVPVTLPTWNSTLTTTGGTGHVKGILLIPHCCLQ